jgi:hypothetical protein
MMGACVFDEAAIHEVTLFVAFTVIRKRREHSIRLHFRFSYNR